MLYAGIFLVEAALAVKMMRSVMPTLACKSSEASTSVAVDVDHINTISGFRLNNTEVGQISMMYEGVVQGHHSIEDFLQLAVFKKFDVLLMDQKTKVCALSRTAKLWCMYMEHIKTIKWFIRAERTGDWNLHLVAVGRMLNLFAATGYNNSAKSGRLYLQMMMKLPHTHTWLYEQFSSNVFLLLGAQTASGLAYGQT